MMLTFFTLSLCMQISVVKMIYLKEKKDSCTKQKDVEEKKTHPNTLNNDIDTNERERVKTGIIRKTRMNLKKK